MRRKQQRYDGFLFFFVGVSATISTAAVVNPVQTPLQMLKTKQQQQQQQSPTPQESTNKMKIYKFHMRTHINKKEPANPILNLTAAKALILVPQKNIRLYRFKVYSKIYDSPNNCPDHVQKHHNQPTSPIKKFQIVLKKKFMKTMQTWKTKWETMLAAIHNDNPTNSGDTQNKD